MEIQVSGWHPDALWTVLDIMHRSSWDVLQTLSLGALVEVVRIVDYYKIKGAMNDHSKQWMDQIQHRDFFSDARSVVSVFLASKLERPELKDKLLKVYHLKSHRLVDLLGLVSTNRILGKPFTLQ